MLTVLQKPLAADLTDVKKIKYGESLLIVILIMLNLGTLKMNFNETKYIKVYRFEYNRLM